MNLRKYILPVIGSLVIHAAVMLGLANMSRASYDPNKLVKIEPAKVELAKGLPEVFIVPIKQLIKHQQAAEQTPPPVEKSEPVAENQPPEPLKPSEDITPPDSEQLASAMPDKITAPDDISGIAPLPDLTPMPNPIEPAPKPKQVEVKPEPVEPKPVEIAKVEPPKEPEPTPIAKPKPAEINPKPVAKPVKKPSPPVESAPDAGKTGVDKGASKKHIPRPIYPRICRRQSQQGTVFLEVTVLPDGNAGDVKVLKSSGYPRLDLAAIDAVRAGEYTPAQKNGKPTTAKLRVPITFRLR